MKRNFLRDFAREFEAIQSTALIALMVNFSSAYMKPTTCHHWS